METTERKYDLSGITESAMKHLCWKASVLEHRIIDFYGSSVLDEALGERIILDTQDFINEVFFEFRNKVTYHGMPVASAEVYDTQFVVSAVCSYNGGKEVVGFLYDFKICGEDVLWFITEMFDLNLAPVVNHKYSL